MTTNETIRSGHECQCPEHDCQEWVRCEGARRVHCEEGNRSLHICPGCYTEGHAPNRPVVYGPIHLEITLTTLRDALHEAFSQACVLITKLPEGATRDLVLASGSELSRRIEMLNAEIATLARHGEAA